MDDMTKNSLRATAIWYLSRRLKLSDAEYMAEEARKDAEDDAQPTEFYKELLASGANVGKMRKEMDARRLEALQRGEDYEQSCSEMPWHERLAEVRAEMGPEATNAEVNERAARIQWGLPT